MKITASSTPLILISVSHAHSLTQVPCPFFCCAFTSTFSCTQLSPMASLIAVSQTQLLYIKPRLVSPPHQSRSVFLPTGLPAGVRGLRATMPRKAVIVSAATAETPKKKGESKGFVEEMRFVAMRLHTRDQAREGEKEVKQPEEKAVTKWDPTVEGYLKFLVDSKVVYDTLEDIVREAPHPSCQCRFSPSIFYWNAFVFCVCVLMKYLRFGFFLDVVVIVRSSFLGLMCVFALWFSVLRVAWVLCDACFNSN